jgi:acyl-CoA oxidase
MKFWIGGAAQSANMCIVAANMTVKGKDYGLHLFVVEIRDNTNHDLIPGVIIGDCGLKQGINGVDNGFIYFRAVRVPLDSLLDKVTQVSASGEVHSIIENKNKRFALQLSALSEGRVKIAFTTLTAGLKGAAIVLRYAAVRRQFGKEKYVESSVIDYPGYQQRIFPYIIMTIVSCFAGMESNRLWQDNYHQILDQKNRTIEEMHAIISCLKPILTWNLLNGLNEFRTAMGGLGYSKHAVIPQMIDDYHVMVTWEGENHVLIQQTGKFLLKQYFKKLSGETTNGFASTDYVTAEPLKWNHKLTNMAVLSSEDVLHSLLTFRAAKALQVAFNHIQSRVGEVGDFDAFNESTVFGLTEASIYYGELYIFRCSIAELSKRPNDENKKFMMQLLQLFVIERVLTSGTILMGYISEEEVNFLRKARIELNNAIRFNLLKSLDYLFLEEHVVVSPFGNKDGDMYGRFISKLLGEQGNFGKPAFWREIWELKNSN